MYRSLSSLSVGPDPMVCTHTRTIRYIVLYFQIKEILLDNIIFNVENHIKSSNKLVAQSVKLTALGLIHAEHIGFELSKYFHHFRLILYQFILLLGPIVLNQSQWPMEMSRI